MVRLIVLNSYATSKHHNRLGRLVGELRRRFLRMESLRLVESSNSPHVNTAS